MFISGDAANTSVEYNPKDSVELVKIGRYDENGTVYHSEHEANTNYKRPYNQVDCQAEQDAPAAAAV